MAAHPTSAVAALLTTRPMNIACPAALPMRHELDVKYSYEDGHSKSEMHMDIDLDDIAGIVAIHFPPRLLHDDLNSCKA
eukprot:3256940-Amphidinium_carterae.1